jgi:hypothetical protein
MQLDAKSSIVKKKVWEPIKNLKKFDYFNLEWFVKEWTVKEATMNFPHSLVFCIIKSLTCVMLLRVRSNFFNVRKYQTGVSVFSN